jgi:hypothetical protein
LFAEGERDVGVAVAASKGGVRHFRWHSIKRSANTCTALRMLLTGTHDAIAAATNCSPVIDTIEPAVAAPPPPHDVNQINRKSYVT